MSTPPTVSVHRATVDDWPDIWPIWHEVVAAGDTYTYEPSSTFEQGRALWLRDAPRDETWLARLRDPETGDPETGDPETGDPETGGRVVGTYHIAPNQTGPGDHVVNGSYMVDATVRGHGVGARLVEHSVARAAQLGFLGMQFNAVAATNVSAIALYERLGFTRVGLVPGAFRHPREGRVDLVVMYRELGPTAS